MNAECVEELQIYQKARDSRLHDQLSASSDAVAAMMSEGFGQSTDRQFAQLLYKSRSESKETRTHLTVAKGRDYVSEGELKRLCDQYDEIEKMTTGFIRHLQREDRKFRG